MEETSQGSFVTTINEEYETIFWGCGLNLVLPSYTPVFKCGWCGAITNQNPVRVEIRNFGLRRFRDRCFVVILAVFMLFVICGGIWAFYPDPKTRPGTDPKNPGPGRTRTDHFTLLGLVGEDPWVLDPTRPEPEIWRVPEIPEFFSIYTVYMGILIYFWYCDYFFNFHIYVFGYFSCFLFIF
ncbi:hypothetical protein N665_0387s0020 [Sinapis alba]|nr:hypothetical protein N665_0387s0020 [Sinapis alba]